MRTYLLKWIGISLVLYGLILPALGAEPELTLEVQKLDQTDFPEVTLTARIKDAAGRTLPLQKAEQVFIREEFAQETSTLKEFKLKNEPESQNSLAMLVVNDLRSSQAPFLDAIKSVSTQLFDLAHPQDYLALAEIHGEPVYQIPQPFAQNEFSDDAQKQSELQKKLLAHIQKQSVDKGRAGPVLWDGLMRAMTEFKKVKAARQVIFVITNGQSNNHVVGLQELYQEAERLKIPFQIIALGSPYQHQDLKKLASRTGGLYTPLFELKDAEKLAKLQYAKAVDSFDLQKAEQITYTSPYLESGTHHVRLRIQTHKNEHIENNQHYEVIQGNSKYASSLWFIPVMGGALVLVLTTLLFKQRSKKRIQSSVAADTPHPPLAGTKPQSPQKRQAQPIPPTSPASNFVPKPSMSIKPAQLIMLSSENTREQIFILKQKTTIGRSSACDVIINDPEVGRKHAQIVLKNSDYFLEDLNSSNGTFINQRQLNQTQTIIKTGDLIQVGATILKFETHNSKTV